MDFLNLFMTLLATLPKTIKFRGSSTSHSLDKQKKLKLVSKIFLILNIVSSCLRKMENIR